MTLSKTEKENDMKAVLFVLLLALGCGGLWAAWHFTKKEKFRSKCGKFAEHAAFAIRALAVCLFLEIFVFNLNMTHLYFGDYPHRVLDMTTAQTQNYNAVSKMNPENGHSVITFEGLNTPVGTLSVHGWSSKKSTMYFSVDIKDTTYSNNYRYGIASVQTIRGNKRSETVPCNFSGTVSDLQLSFDSEDGESVTIDSIEINKPIGLHFSLLRLLILFGGALIVYALAHPALLRRSYSEIRQPARNIAWGFTGCLVALALFLTNMARYQNSSHSISADLKSTYGNQISQEIVDAFEAGRVDLDLPSNPDLLALDNPYDGSQRDGVGYYPWDHLLFEGKYYSYYGIAPVLILFLPYHAITGYYFPSCWAVWLFGIFGIIFLSKFYLCFIDKFFRKIPASLVLIGLAIMQMSTGVFFNFYYANFYEIAQVSGFLFVTAGAYFLMSANVIGDGKIINWRMAVSAACLSMGVLSRPTLAVYCICALIFIYAGFRKLKGQFIPPEKEKDAKPTVKYYLPYLLCSLVPFAVIGSIQIWYNWVRFGNPLDFGIQYSLTINDFINAQYHTHFALLGIYSYILAYPNFTEHFPFMFAEGAKTFNPNGYYFLATGAAMGLLWRALPITAYCKAKHAYRLSDSPWKRLYAILIAAVCVICPFVIIFSIWESGYGTRYCVDFAWQMILGALIISFLIYSRCKENTQRHLNSVMIGAGILSLAMNFVQLWSYNPPDSLFPIDWQAKAMTFARLFEFWR